MRRCTRSAAALLLLAVTLTACSPPTSGSSERIVGVYGPTDPIPLVNRSLPDNRYQLTASIQLFVVTRGQRVDFACAMVDTTGQLGILGGTAMTVLSGRWYEITLTTELELPDTTLGLRCFPQRTAYVDVLVETAQLNAVQVQPSDP